MDKPGNLCVAFIPNWRDNPYLDLLENALRRIGVEVVTNPNGGPYRSWLATNRNSIDVLHFHWLSHLYGKSGLLSGIMELIKFGVRLRKAKKLDYRIVWTMHNLYPHERSNPILDRSMRRLILRFADVVIVHCQAAEELFRKEFDWSGETVIAPIGNYIGVYENSCSRLQARKQLGVDENSVLFLHLGAIRQYKGLDQLVSSFQSLPYQNANLIIAGKQMPENWFSQSETIVKAKSDSRIKINLEWVENEEMQYYLNASDYFVAPFKDILSTSSLILAMSFGRPIIAPRLGCIAELVPPNAGILYDPAGEQGLEHALNKAFMSDATRMGAHAYEVAQTLDWDEAANIVLSAYRSNT